MADDTIYFGKINFRNEEKNFGIKIDDRRRHIYIVGKSGTGKSTLISNMVVSDILAGRGVCLVDPHGEIAEEVLQFVPEDRINDVIYFNPSDIKFPIAFNPLEKVSFEMRHLVASGLMSVFKKIWPDVWSARMEYILNNALLALLEYPNSTLLGIMKMLSDKQFRKSIVENLQDPVVRSFWVDEFAKYTQRLETEAVAAIQNKVGQFVTNPLIRNIVGQVHSSFDMRRVMDEQKIIIVNLSKGKIGEDNSALLGAMIITKLQLAAMSRVDMPMEDRKDFYLYVDEFQNFATESFATILSEARKYRLSLTLAHQYIDQLDEKVRFAIFGNVGTMVVFRVGASDAEVLETEFAPDFEASDFVNLPNYNVYIRLMIDGVTSKPFSAVMLPPMEKPQVTLVEEIKALSREKFALPQEKVEEKISLEYFSPEDNSQEMIKRRDERPLEEMLRKPQENFVKKEHEKTHPQAHVNVEGLKDVIRKSIGFKGNDNTELKP
jgi:hypothetical protein